MATQHSRKSGPNKSAASKSRTSAQRGKPSRASNGGARGNPGSRGSSARKAQHAGGRSSQHGRAAGQHRERSTGSASSSSKRQAKEQNNPGRSPGENEKGGLVTRAAGGIRQAGSKTVDTAREHPVTAALLGAGVAAGLTVLAVRAFRGGSSSARQDEQARGRGPQESADYDDDEGEEGDPDQAQGYADEGDEEDDGGDADEDEEGDGFIGRARSALGNVQDRASRLGDYVQGGLTRVGGAVRQGASSLGQGIEQGYDRGVGAIGQVWEDHPLITGAALLGLGVAAGMLLPSSGAEKKILGKASGKLTGKIRSAGQELTERGKELASRVVEQVGDTLLEEAEREGLSPQKLARKVRRIAGRLKDVVADATG